ncbi:MAG: hypothetical protein IJQ59_05050 [Bacteroidaceae bacterium]|nr:hypothetical protein [Bacteroidaceae bacterium]
MEDTNDDRVRIKRCCASCAFKRLTRTTLRFCRLHGKLVMSSEVCENWQISRLMRSVKSLMV